MGDISIKGKGLLGGKGKIRGKLIEDVDRADFITRAQQQKKKKKYVFDSSAARKKDLKQQAYRAKVEELGGKVKFAGEWKKGGKV